MMPTGPRCPPDADTLEARRTGMSLGQVAVTRRLRELGEAYTRENWIALNWAGCDLGEWTAEHVDELPTDWRST
jgi:hypothetical protein